MRLQHFFETFLDILYPPICAACEKSLDQTEKDQRLCTNCLNSIPLFNAFFCSRCRSRLANNQKNCHPDAPLLLAAATSYNNGIAQKLIWELKFNRRTVAAYPLAEILGRYLASLNFDFANYQILPIPLSKSRERERSFNQSLEIAKILSVKTGLKIIKGAMIRIKHTKPQTEMTDWDERKTNIMGCFKINKPRLVESQNIILLDDVFTSGATLNEAARILKAGGAKKIVGLVIAKV